MSPVSWGAATKVVIAKLFFCVLTLTMADAVRELFDYNREAFKFNAEIHQKGQFQNQKMRVRQVVLYREDLRDLFGLTVGRMDSYMIVNVLFLGICGEMYYKGRVPPFTPSWVFWAWAVNISSAMYYLFLSLWLALHASVEAQTFSTRALTQWLRLPIPGHREISDATKKAQDFEGSGATDFVKVPVAAERLSASSTSAVPEPSRADYFRDDLVVDWDKYTEHFRIFNSLHQRWQTHEAFSRVSTTVGTNSMLSAVSYFGIIYYGLDYNTPLVAWAITFISTVMSLLHVRMNLILTLKEAVLVNSLIILAPLSICVACGLEGGTESERQTQSLNTDYSSFISCFAVACHAALTLVLFKLATPEEGNSLPVKYNTVWAIDVLGFGLDMDQPLLPGLRGPPTEIILPDDEALKQQIKTTEKTLQRLFTRWQVKSATLSDEQMATILELKENFTTERNEIKRMMSAQSVTGGTAVAANWVKLEYQTEIGNKLAVPYFLNIETGELRWDPPNDDFEINRGFSRLPEEVSRFRAATRAVAELKKEEKLLKNPDKTRKNIIQPWDLFWIGSVVIILVWFAAFALTLIDALGVSIASPTYR